MEGCDGDLECLIRGLGPLMPNKSLHLIFELAESLLIYYFKASFLHCDIKPRNVLFTTDVNGTRTYKITDFGSSSIGTPSYFFMNERSIGTLSYLPIEAILNCLWVFVSPKTDSWSLGLVFCYVASGCDFIEQHNHFDCFGLGECRRMMEELLRRSPRTFIDSLGSIDSPMVPAFAEAALRLFLVFFPFKADLPESDIIFVEDGPHYRNQAMLEGILRREEFQRAHERLALFRFEDGVQWNTGSPFYQMMGFNLCESSTEELCCKVLSGLMDFNPAERHSLAQTINLLEEKNT
jgi:serine/threonine protein kinase